MKISDQSFDQLLGTRKRVRHKTNTSLSLEQYFEEPIIHREIQGDRVYVPLDLNRAWNKI
jgi:hypothetical protein